MAACVTVAYSDATLATNGDNCLYETNAENQEHGFNGCHSNYLERLAVSMLIRSLCDCSLSLRSELNEDSFFLPTVMQLSRRIGR